MAGKRTWTIPVEEDENGDCVIAFPEDALAQVGWHEGDVLKWTKNKDMSWTLSKKEDNVKDTDDSETVVPIARATINDLHRLMEATDLDEVEMIVSHGSGIGPSVKFRYSGVIDATDYDNW